MGPPVSFEVKPYRVNLPIEVVVVVDTSGSVAAWRQEIFDRLAMLYRISDKICRGGSATDSTRVGLDTILSLQFVGVGDAVVPSDTIEVAPPGSGPELDRYLAQMRKDCSGGGNDQESVDLALLYVDRFLEAGSKSRHRIVVIITDEGYPDQVLPEQARRWLGVSLPEPIQMKSLVQKLNQKGWSLFCVQKPYNEDMGGKTIEFHRDWQGLLGSERVVQLDEARRVIDVLIGILSIQVGKYDHFVQDLNDRHLTQQNKFGPSNVQTVMRALRPASTVLGMTQTRAPQTVPLLPEHPVPDRTVLDLLDPDMT